MVNEPVTGMSASANRYTQERGGRIEAGFLE